jgi:hypothetical protein
MAGPIPAASGRIFISYRREETAYPAGWLFDRLTYRYGGNQVFKDVDSIELGDDFVEVITRAVGSCDVLLALIGEEWLTTTDEHGRRRLDNPEDFVRLEIEAALARNVRVIPILIDGARMPRADELPASLARLVRRQALELSPARFDFDTGRLLKVLDRTLDEVRTAQQEAASMRAPEEASEQWAREQAEKHAARVRVVRARVDRAEELLRRREYEQALSLCAEVMQGFGNSADPALLAHIERARDLSQQANKQLVRRRSRWRWGLVGIAAAIAIGIFLGWRLGERPVEIPATRDWTDTRVDCKAGNVLEIAATGTIYHNKFGGRGVGPDGDPNPKLRRHNVGGLPDANHGELIGSIDRQRPYFPVGKKTTYTCSAGGRLFLGINDRDLVNNSGKFSATIKGRS